VIVNPVSRENQQNKHIYTHSNISYQAKLVMFEIPDDVSSIVNVA